MGTEPFGRRQDDQRKIGNGEHQTRVPRCAAISQVSGSCGWVLRVGADSGTKDECKREALNSTTRREFHFVDGVRYANGLASAIRRPEKTLVNCPPLSSKATLGGGGASMSDQSLVTGWLLLRFMLRHYAPSPLIPRSTLPLPWILSAHTGRTGRNGSY
jgi:hypothetical protein